MPEINPHEAAMMVDPRQVAWRMLLTLHAHACRKIDADLRQVGALSFDAYDVLLTLNEAEGGSLRMSELADAVLLSDSGMSRRVTRLVGSGLVTRRQSRSDGRVFHVKLTAKGRKALDATWLRYKPLIDDVFSRFLSEKEALVMAGLLEKILNGTGQERHRNLLEKGMTDAPQ